MQRKQLSPEQKQAIREISATVTRLLAHYWTADDRVETRQAQIEDWVEDLAEFGAAIVHQACRVWRRDNARRPLPSDIRTLCIAEQNAQRERLRYAEDKTKAQAGPRWDAAVYEAWGPAATAAAARNAAIAENEARYARAAAWRAAGSNPIPHGTLDPLENFIAKPAAE